MQRELRHDKLIEAHAFGLRLAGQSRMERLKDAHIEFAAERES